MIAPSNKPEVAPKHGTRFDGKSYREGQQLPAKYRRVMEPSTRPRDPAIKSADSPPNYGRAVLPHVVTFRGMVTTLSRAYTYSDEAMRDSVENAHMMLNDPSVTGPLLARQRITALLNWSIEPEDDKDQRLVEVAEQLTKILKRTPRFTEYRRSMLNAIWYGRYANQNQYGWHTDSTGARRVVISKWTPVSGDKLLFRFDDGMGIYDPDQVGVRVSPALLKDDQFAGRRELEVTNNGMGYFLEPWERSRFAVHKHLIQDGEYEDPLGAGRINGVGIRSFLYWTWYQKQETLAQLVEIIERTGQGIMIYHYPTGNSTARDEVEKIAAEQAHTNVLLVPHDATAPDNYTIEQIPANTAGLDALHDMVRNFYQAQITKFILGQTLTTEATATGLGSGLAELHKDSLFQIVKYDAVNLEETITEEVLKPLRNFNFPQYRNFDFFFRVNTESSDPEKAMAAASALYEMGVPLNEMDLLDKVGMSLPTESDPRVINPNHQLGLQQVEQNQNLIDNPPPPIAIPQPGVPGAQAGTPGNETNEEQTLDNEIAAT